MEFYDDRPDVLCHHGVKGMKWGVRRSESQLARARGNKKKVASETDDPKRESARKRVGEMTDDELNQAIRRLELERRYSDLTKPKEKQKLFDGKRFIVGVLEQSGKQVASQVVTYGLGKSINKIMGADVVNIKGDGKKDDKK